MRKVLAVAAVLAVLGVLARRLMTDPGARTEPTRTRKRSPAAEGSAR